MLALGLGISLAECAPVPTRVAPEYVPEAAVAPMPGAERIEVAVEANDLQADQYKVGSVTGAISLAGDRRITSTVDAKALVKSAVEKELASRGFQVKGGPLSVIIDLTEFNLEQVVTVSWFTADESHAEVAMHVQVRGPGAANAYSRLISGRSESSQGDDQAILNAALKAAILDLFHAPSFTAAIVTASGGRPSAT